MNIMNTTSKALTRPQGIENAALHNSKSDLFDMTVGAAASYSASAMLAFKGLDVALESCSCSTEYLPWYGAAFMAVVLGTYLGFTAASKKEDDAAVDLKAQILKKA